MPLPHIRAVIFDCDGVLVDSEPLHDSATRETFNERGVTVPDEFFHHHIGMRVFEQIGVLAGQHGLDHSELFSARERRFWNMAPNGFAAIPGSAATVRDLHAAGLKIAVASSGSRPWIDHVITTLGFVLEISESVSGDDVVEAKPHPEPYLAAAHALGVPTNECGVVEDSHRGYRSAVAAGCRVVVLNRDGVEPQRFPEAVAVVASMRHAREVLLRLAGAPESDIVR